MHLFLYIYIYIYIYIYKIYHDIFHLILRFLCNINYIFSIGSSELCIGHVKYLLKVYAVLMTRSNSLEVVVLENLIGRLYNLLPEETKHILITEFDDLENPSWLPVARFLPSKTKSFLESRLACVLNEIPTAFAELQRQPTVQNWDHIVNYVRINFSFLFLSFLFSFSDDFNRIIIFHI